MGGWHQKRKWPTFANQRLHVWNQLVVVLESPLELGLSRPAGWVECSINTYYLNDEKIESETYNWFEMWLCCNMEKVGRDGRPSQDAYEPCELCLAKSVQQANKLI
jgi:hypothetical protein